MLRRYWLAILIAGALVTARPHREILWDRSAAPGAVVHRALVVRNSGARDVALTNLSAELTLESGRLAEGVQVVVTTDAAGADEPVAHGTLAQFVARPQALGGGGMNLKAGESTTLHIWLTVPPSLGREVQPVVSFGVGAEAR